MPYGCSSMIPWVSEDTIQRSPKSILDLGIGYGMYGAVIRQYAQDFKKEKVRLVGVEGFPSYRTALWDFYSEVKEIEIRAFLSTNTEKFDTIILSDVLEHFNHRDGNAVLRQLKQTLNPGGILWVGTPGVWFEQQAIFGNDLEIHRSFWSVDDLKDVGLIVVADGHHDIAGNPLLMGKFVCGGK